MDDKLDLDAAKFRVERMLEENKATIEVLLAKGDIIDEDGYPTEDALTIIEKWSWNDSKGWFKFIHDIWYYREWGWREEQEMEKYEYNISTAGWSGNESIIRAMQQNLLWSLTWVQSRRGGHYIFEEREIK